MKMQPSNCALGRNGFAGSEGIKVRRLSSTCSLYIETTTGIPPNIEYTSDKKPSREAASPQYPSGHLSWVSYFSILVRDPQLLPLMPQQAPPSCTWLAAWPRPSSDIALQKLTKTTNGLIKAACKQPPKTHYSTINLCISPLKAGICSGGVTTELELSTLCEFECNWQHKGTSH